MAVTWMLQFPKFAFQDTFKLQPIEDVAQVEYLVTLNQGNSDVSS
jgi:hypothetical protein